jgi:hypothetical protein
MAYQVTQEMQRNVKFFVCLLQWTTAELAPVTKRERTTTFSTRSDKQIGIVSAAAKALGRGAMSRIWQALRQAERERRGLGPEEGPDIEQMEREPLSDEEEPRLTRGSDRRKEERAYHQTTVLVYGSDAEKQPFHEQCETVDANETGCLLMLASGVSRGQRLFLTNMRNQAEQECRVVHVGRKVQGKTRVGIEFVRPAPLFWRKA